MYVNSDLVDKVYPSTYNVVGYIKKAEQVGEYRDVRPLMSLLQRMTVASPRIAGHILTRRTAVSSFKWSLTGPEKYAELAETLLSPAIEAILNNQVSISLFGAMLLEFDWKLRSKEELKADKERFVPVLKRIYSPVEIEKKDNQDIIILETVDKYGKMERREIKPAENFISATDGTNWHGGVLRSVVFHEILRNDTLKEWGNFNKKLKGMIQAKSDEAQKADAVNALANFTENNVAVTGTEVEFMFKELTSSKAVESFDTFKRTLENDIAIAILGQANTPELPTGGGSRAALQVQNMIRADIHYADMERAEQIINKQLLPVFHAKNFAGSNVEPFKFEFIYDEIQDLETNARVIEKALNMGIPILAEEAYHKLNLSMPNDGDKLLTVTPQRMF